jgi:hypothetical protein
MQRYKINLKEEHDSFYTGLVMFMSCRQIFVIMIGKSVIMQYFILVQVLLKSNSPTSNLVVLCYKI